MFFNKSQLQGIKNWLVNLFGENYFDPSKNKWGEWSMRPSEISSIKAENEAALYDKGIWDNTKEKFSEKHLNKLLSKDLQHYKLWRRVIFTRWCIRVPIKFIGI